MKLKSTAAGLAIAASLGFASTASATIALTFVGLQNLEPILNYYDGGLGLLAAGPVQTMGSASVEKAETARGLSEDGNRNEHPF